MIDGYFHIELGGIKYRLAEDYEGQHYMDVGAPLRPPNAQVIQGDNSVFQSRPDLLVWRWEDWSGGEGQYKWDQRSPERYWTGRNVDGFSEKGIIKPGPLMERIQPYEAADEGIELVRLGNTLYLFENATGDMHQFLGENPPSWLIKDFTVTNSDAYWGALPVGDSFAVYAAGNDGTDYSVYRHDGSSQTTINTDITCLGTGQANQFAVLETVGNYLYLIDMDLQGEGVNVYELSKNPASPPAASTLIYDLSDSANDFPQTRANGAKPASYQTCVTAGPNRLYFFTTLGDSTHVHEVIPTTAFSTGYGQEIAVLPGFNAEGIWYHSGFVYLLGKQGSADGDPAPRRQLLYIDLEGAYGLVSGDIGVGSGTSRPSVAWEASGLAKSRFMVPEAKEENFLSIIELDHRTGGLQHLTEVDASTYNDVDGSFSTLFSFQDRLIVAASGASTGTDETYVTQPDEPQFSEPCFVVSPWLDFGSTDTKLLSSFIVRFAKAWTGSDWTVQMYYRTEDDAAWTSIASTTDGATTRWEFVASSSSADIEFDKIQFKLEFDAGGTTTAQWPRVTSVEAHAQMAQKFRVRELLLSCSDEHSQAQSRSLRGVDQIDNIQTLGTTATPVAFKDGYTDRNPNSFDSYDVVVDEYRIILERAGEGVGWVRLVEVA